MEIKVSEHLRSIINHTFQILLFLFLLTLLLQQFFPLEVAGMLNINWFMLAVIIIGAFAIFFPPKKEIQDKKPVTWKDKSLAIFLGIAGSVIIYLKLNPLGWIAWAISILGGLIIILLSWMVLEED